MTRKSQTPTASQAQKRELKRLRDKGIYKPKNPRAAPTRYALSLLNKFADIATGKASVVTAKSAKRGNKGFKEAAALKSDSSSMPGTIRVVRNKIIVPTQGDERARFTRRGLRVTRKVGNDKYIRTPFKTTPKNLADILSQLKENERVVIPLFRTARKGVEWVPMSRDDFIFFVSQYGPGGSRKSKSGEPQLYENLFDYIEKFHIEGPSSDYIEPKEPLPSTKRKSRAKKKSNPKSKRKLV